MKKKNRKARREFLFDDLVVLPTEEINSARTQIKEKLSMKEDEHEQFQNERKTLVEFVKKVRGILMGPRNPEISELVSRLKIAQNNRDNAKKLRADFDKRVPPSPKDIIESLKQRHKPLWTISNRIQEIPTLKEEINLFESYFEYQAMYEIALKSDEQQQILLDAYKEIKNTMKAIKKFDLEDIDDNEFSKIQEKYPEKNIGWESVDSSSKKISEIDDWCQNWIKEKRTLYKEIQRLEAYLRIRGKEAEKESLKIKSEVIREKAETGGTLSLDDLSALISTGEIGKITDSNQEIDRNDKKKRNKKSRNRRSNARRGKPRSTKRTHKEDGND
tara:strand:+ start:118 stop:1110 length:993 start_codon:yes stop_codon:yes gene_type:complete